MAGTQEEPFDPSIPPHVRFLQEQMDRSPHHIIIGQDMAHMSEEVWRNAIMPHAQRWLFPELEEEAKKYFEMLFNTEEWSKVDKDIRGGSD